MRVAADDPRRVPFAVGDNDLYLFCRGYHMVIGQNRAVAVDYKPRPHTFLQVLRDLGVPLGHAAGTRAFFVAADDHIDNPGLQFLG